MANGAWYIFRHKDNNRIRNSEHSNSSNRSSDSNINCMVMGTITLWHMPATLDMAIADRDRALAAKAAVQEYQLARGRLMYQSHGVPGMDARGQNDGDHSYIQVHYTSSSVCLSDMSSPSTCLPVYLQTKSGIPIAQRLAATIRTPS